MVNRSPFNGRPSLGWTLAKNLDAGRPPSLCLSAWFQRRVIKSKETNLENAKIIRLLVVMTLTVANTRHTRGSLNSISTDFPLAHTWVWIDIHKQTNSPSTVLSWVNENLQERPGRGVDHRIDIPSHEQEHNEEDGTGESANPDTRYHDLRAFAARIGNFYFVSQLEIELDFVRYLRSYGPLRQMQ